jgi:hypothetical protein
MDDNVRRDEMVRQWMTTCVGTKWLIGKKALEAIRANYIVQNDSRTLNA